MMMGVLNYANFVTTLGGFIIFNETYFSKTCVNGNNENNCLSCSTDHLRIFNETKNSCIGPNPEDCIILIGTITH